MLPDRLQAYFHELAEGKTIPPTCRSGLLGGGRACDACARGAGETEPLSRPLLEGIESLTDREREILKMIALGMSNKVIGAKLFISEKTVKTHANHVFRKLGVSSRLQATLVFQSYQRAGAAGPAGPRRRR